MFVQASYRGPAQAFPRDCSTSCSKGPAGGIEEVFLGTTEKFLAAHRFYERNGFQQIAAAELPQAFQMALEHQILPSRTLTARRLN